MLAFAAEERLLRRSIVGTDSLGPRAMVVLSPTRSQEVWRSSQETASSRLRITHRSMTLIHDVVCGPWNTYTGMEPTVMVGLLRWSFEIVETA